MLRMHDGLTAERRFALRGAMLIYAGDAGAIVTAHQVAGGKAPGDGGPMELLAGGPLTLEQAGELVRGIQGLAPTRVIFPERLLSWDGRRLCWWAPSARRRIWFDARQQKHLQHLSRREVLHPPLVFVADPGRLYVYALAENQRPGPDSPVYQAPYLNTYEDGMVCAGAVLLPQNADVSDLDLWELVWFDSEGTHATASELTRYPGGHDALWDAMRTAEEFPADSLVPTPWTLLDVLNRAPSTRADEGCPDPAPEDGEPGEEGDPE